MNEQNTNQLPHRDTAASSPLREIFGDAIRYWEPRRLIYNLVLVAVVLTWLFLSWPHFRHAVAMGSLLFLLIFAILANVCYCAAYIADVPIQYSPFQAMWRRRRWGLWAAGMLFATLLANYWIADEIYPYVR
ncbi:MAG TPA: hypothetical protein VJO53_06160 [Candidatus Acidoferrales bacterium]|nr:hypothetical protein [Candidatus Acidoferrales bacterium]